MKTSEYTLKCLEPENESSWLTQSEDVEIAKRLFAKKVYISALDSADNYKEITDDEYNTLKASKEKAIEDEIAAKKAEASTKAVES